MARGATFSSSLKAIDAFGKTLDDVKVRTRTGAFLTFASITLIIILTLVEWIDYRSVYLDTDIVVDKIRDERITVSMNITFPRVPCFLLSIDVTDASGEHVRDISHNILKTRLNNIGEPVVGAELTSDLRNDVEKVGKTREKGFCGSCYGGLEPEGGCCNDCESVRQAYLNRGWAFSNPDAIEQCVAEHWVEKIKDQINEGCNVSGRVRVKKVATNMQFSPGRSYQSNYMHRHDLVPYLRDNAPHDFGHLIHEFRFESDDEYDISKFKIADRVRKRLGIDKNPLDGTQVHYRLYKLPSRAVAQFMFQYFVKIVGTQFNTMDNVPVTLLNAGRQDSRLRMHISSHQYSATSFVRDLGQQSHVTNEEGIELTHGFEAFPGVFMNLETSPMQIVHTEKRKPFAYFLTTFCAIIGGVLTVASLIDSAVFNTLNTVEDEQQRQRRSL